MLDLGIEKIGELGIVECIGGIVGSEDAIKLGQAVTSLENLRIIVLDLSEVNAIEDGGLGMLRFLLQWTRDHEIRFKMFNPRKSVLDRLEFAGSVLLLHIASLEEMMVLLANADNVLAPAA